MMRSSSGSWGSERKRSVTRIKPWSTIPPAYPAAAPMMVPTMIAMSMATRPTASEMRPP